jgi:hypothetical protein
MRVNSTATLGATSAGMSLGEAAVTAYDRPEAHHTYTGRCMGHSVGRVARRAPPRHALNPKP